MLSDKFFNPFISDIFWRYPYLSKLRVGLANTSKSFTSGLSQRFFLSAEEEAAGVVSEEIGQLRLHLRSIFAYNRAAFHVAKWETAAVGGFVQLADLFFSKQKCYWAGEGNYGSRTGGASPLFFQNLSNFSTVTSFERILFRSDARATLGRFLLRFNQTAPFYLNGLGRKNTSLVNYRARPQSQFLRELEPTTKIPAELFDTPLPRTSTPANFKNGGSSVTLHSRGHVLGMLSQQMGTLRLVYLNDFASFLRLSDQYRRRHLVRAYVGFAFGNGTCAANSWISRSTGCGASDLYAARSVFKTTRRAVLKIAPYRKTNFLISCGFAHLGPANFSAFMLAVRSVYRTYALILMTVLPLSRARILTRAHLLMKLPLLTSSPCLRNSSEPLALLPTYEINKFSSAIFNASLNALNLRLRQTDRLHYRADLRGKTTVSLRARLAHLSKWEVSLASKYKAVLDRTANLETEEALKYKENLSIIASIERTVIENYTLTLDGFARDIKQVEALYEKKLKFLRKALSGALLFPPLVGRQAATSKIKALKVDYRLLVSTALHEYFATIRARHRIDGGAAATAEPIINLIRGADIEYSKYLTENAHLTCTLEEEYARLTYTWKKEHALPLSPYEIEEVGKILTDFRHLKGILHFWFKTELKHIFFKQLYAKSRIKIAPETSEESLYRDTLKYTALIFSKSARLWGEIFDPYVPLKHPAALNYRWAWFYSLTAEYENALTFNNRVRLIKRNSRIPCPRVCPQLLSFAGVRKPRGVEKFISARPVTGMALGFLQTLLTTIAGATFSKLTPLVDNLNSSVIRRSDYRLWFNKLVLESGAALSNHKSNLLFMIFDRTGTLSGRALGIVGQLFRKSFYARRYLKLFSTYNELVLTQTCGVAYKHWLYRLAKSNERASVSCVRGVTTRFASSKYVDLLAIPSNALTCMRTHAEAAVVETAEIGLIGFARVGASKHHAEFFLLFSGAQFGCRSTLTNYRMLSPVNRFAARRSHRRPTPLNFDMEFFDRIAGVMWSTNAVFPAKGQASVGNPFVMSQFNVTLSLSSFAPEYRRSWFFNTLDSVQSFGLTRTILCGGAATGISDFNHELVMCLPWSVSFLGLRTSAALLCSSIQLGGRSTKRVNTLSTAGFWGRINSLLFYDL